MVELAGSTDLGALDAHARQDAHFFDRRNASVRDYLLRAIEAR
jgi:hypothetical protein